MPSRSLMPLAFLLCLSLLVCGPLGVAGTLHLAVVRFPGLVDEATLQAALAGESLGQATAGDRFAVRDPTLRGAPVLFAQSFPFAVGQSLRSSTRLAGQRADVEATLQPPHLRAQVLLSEGAQAPLRRFRRLVYRGAGPFIVGPVGILSLRQLSSRTPSIVRGSARVSTSETTTALLAQFQP